MNEDKVMLESGTGGMSGSSGKSWKSESVSTKPLELYSTLSSPKPRYADRFIPSRAGNSWDLDYDINPATLVVTPKMSLQKTWICDIQTFNSTDARNLEAEKVSPSLARKAYRAVLGNEVLGRGDENVDDAVLDGRFRSRGLGKVSRRLFNYDTAARSQPCNSSSVYTTSPISASSESLLTRTKSVWTRKIPIVPWKVLDAPGLLNNFYYNIIHVSSQNTIAVGLGHQIYTQKNCSEEVKLLTDPMDARLREDGVPNSVSWNPKGDLLAVGTSSGSIQIWDVEASKLLSIYHHIHEKRVGSVCWNGNYFITSGSQDGSIWQRDIRSGFKTGEVRRMEHSDYEEVCKVTWSSDSINLAAGGSEGHIFVWDIRMTNYILRCEEHVAAVKALDWSPHASHVFASGGGFLDHSLRIWDILRGNQSIHKFGLQSQISNVLWSPLNEELVTSHGSMTDNLTVLKYEDTKVIKTLATIRAHTGRVWYMAMIPDGQSIVTGASDELVKFWNLFPKRKKGLSVRRSIFTGCIR